MCLFNIVDHKWMKYTIFQPREGISCESFKDKTEKVTWYNSQSGQGKLYQGANGDDWTTELPEGREKHK